MKLSPTYATALVLWMALSGCVVVDITRDVIENRPPKPNIDDERNPLIVIETNKGKMTAELYERSAKNIVAYFVYMIESNVYANRTFYKADEKAVDAGPRAKPLGFRVRRQPSRHGHEKHALSMKGSRDGSLSADFMIMREDAFDLDKENTVIGRITSGKWTLWRIEKGDVVKRIYVKRKKSHPYVPTVESDGRIRTR